MARLVGLTACTWQVLPFFPWWKKGGLFRVVRKTVEKWVCVTSAFHSRLSCKKTTMRYSWWFQATKKIVTLNLNSPKKKSMGMMIQSRKKNIFQKVTQLFFQKQKVLLYSSNLLHSIRYVIYHISLPSLKPTKLAMENPPFWWYLQGNMGIFMDYVSFREGIPQKCGRHPLAHHCCTPWSFKSPGLTTKSKGPTSSR